MPDAESGPFLRVENGEATISPVQAIVCEGRWGCKHNVFDHTGSDGTCQWDRLLYSLNVKLGGSAKKFEFVRTTHKCKAVAKHRRYGTTPDPGHGFATPGQVVLTRYQCEEYSPLD